MKRRIRKNIYGNWKGYVGREMVWDFGVDEVQAEAWLATGLTDSRSEEGARAWNEARERVQKRKCGGDVKVTRVNSGIYDVDIGGRTFCIERTDAGDEWILKEEKTFGDGYIDHFRTKRSALEYLRSIKGAREENPMKHFREPFHVDFHSERGEVSIHVTDADDNEVWYADTDMVNELIEDGFLDSRGFIMGRNVRPDVLERSVISYLRSVGIIADRSEKPSRHAPLPTTVYDDARDLYDENPCGHRRNPGDIHIDIQSHNTRGSHVRAKNPAHVDAEHFHPMRGHVDEGVSVRMADGTIATVKNLMRGWVLMDASGREMTSPVRDAHLFTREVLDANDRIRMRMRRENPIRKLWVIQWFNEDHPVEPMWMERTSFEGTHDEAMETLNILQKKQPHIEFRLAEDRLRSRRENPTREDVDGWIDHYRTSMEKRIDGVPERAHYVVKIVTKDGQDAWLRVGKGTKFDTDPAKARVYRNGDKANEAATKVANWLKKKQPAKWKKIATISAEPKK